jgi:hypothetical protein
MTFQPSIFVCCHYQIAIFVLVLWACATHLHIWREIKKYYEIEIEIEISLLTKSGPQEGIYN